MAKDEPTRIDALLDKNIVSIECGATYRYVGSHIVYFIFTVSFDSLVFLYPLLKIL